MLLRLLLRGCLNQAKSGCQDFAEAFSGIGNLTRELLRAGYEGSSFDIQFEASHDVTHSKGVRLVLDSITCVKQTGLLWIATECSSFVVLCRAISKRSPENQYLGDTSRPFVTTGNLLMTVSSLFFFVAAALQIWVVLEQPQSSCLHHCPLAKAVFEYTGARCFRSYMGCFSGQSVKPLSLFSTWPEVCNLECQRPSWPRDCSLVKRHDDSHRFTGKKEELKFSQCYTPQFAKKVVEICRAAWH